MSKKTTAAKDTASTPVEITLQAKLKDQEKRFKSEKARFNELSSVVMQEDPPAAADLVVDHLDPATVKLKFLELVSDNINWAELSAQKDFKAFTQGMTCILSDIAGSVSVSTEVMRDAEFVTEGGV